MLERYCTKQEIWEKYTGRRQEHGRIIEWMRQLGYIEGYKVSNKKVNLQKEQIIWKIKENRRTIRN